METINQFAGAILSVVGALFVLFGASFVITAGVKLALRAFEE